MTTFIADFTEDGVPTPAGTSPGTVRPSGPTTRVGTALISANRPDEDDRSSLQRAQYWGVTSALGQRKVADRGKGISVVPPLAFQGIRTGDDFSVEYEPSESVPVSGTPDLLRNLSPFVIQVEPPLTFANLPRREYGAKKTHIGIIEAAYAASASSYSAARAAASEAPYANIGYGGAIEEVLSRNGSGPRNRGPSDRGKAVASDGSGRLGEPAIADLKVAMDIATQISALLNTPPLVLLINPQSLQRTFTKVQQFTDRSRHGYIFQAWGEDQPKLAISARIGAFISGGRGVQFASRRDSAAYQNLMSVLHFYKSNGYIYDTVGKSNAHHHVGSLSLRYDQWVYYGHMQSMSFSFEETNSNGGVQFELQFTVSAMLDAAPTTNVVVPMRSPLPSPSDPRFSGRQVRASNEPGALYLGSGESARRFAAEFLPPAPGGFQGPSASSTRPTSQPVNTRGFVAPTATVTVGPRQAPVSSPSLRFAFTSALSGVNLP